MKKIILLAMFILSIPLYAESLSHIYQNEYTKKACVVIHFKHDIAEVFELYTKPQFLGMGDKYFRAVERFKNGELEITKGVFKTLCSDLERIDSEDSSTFICNEEEMVFTVIYNQDRTISDVLFKYKNKTYECRNLLGPNEYHL